LNIPVFAVVLAQAATQQTQPLPFYMNGQLMLFLFIGALLVYMMFASSRTRKAEQKKHQDMLTNMKRGDRVLTIGGILATVVDARESEVVLKVDESNNTKVRFSRDAIKKVLGPEDATAEKN
jgi:preprotein translocase subunit YajC